MQMYVAGQSKYSPPLLSSYPLILFILGSLPPPSAFALSSAVSPSSRRTLYFTRGGG